MSVVSGPQDSLALCSTESLQAVPQPHRPGCQLPARVSVVPHANALSASASLGLTMNE